MPAPPPEPPAADGRDDLLVSFTPGAEDDPPGDAPLPLALTALWHGGEVAMVLDRYRGRWELPGGRIEAGETPRRAALRELREESGQEPGGPLRFVGFAGFLLGPARRAEYGALFTGRAPRRHPFEANDEIEALCWWDLRAPLPGRVSDIDARLARLVRRTVPPGPPFPS
ncbi:NUDIX hydrolase [Streptomyces ziwulingensis]|uniref:Nudix hydrolase domain-containing protein n=1 Tax=Streptomyces ziwulingensis TaxID=1045501 RepID=A0ABP9BTW6_9ACTN